jgi:DNA-binding NarL/FixJ family response regulator
MAVLSDPSAGTLEPKTFPCMILSAGAEEIERRIERALLEGEIEVVPTPVPSAEALGDLDADPEAIIVFACDVDLPRELAILRRLRRELRQSPIVAVSPVATGTGVRRALDAGAAAIVFEPELESTVAVAVSAVASGQSVVPRNMRASVERPAFSHRERQVLTYVARGFTNAQIAEELFLSESTIKSHLSTAFAKFGVRSRKEAAALFLELEQMAVTT